MVWLIPASCPINDVLGDYPERFVVAYLVGVAIFFLNHKRNTFLMSGRQTFKHEEYVFHEVWPSKELLSTQRHPQFRGLTPLATGGRECMCEQNRNWSGLFDTQAVKVIRQSKISVSCDIAQIAKRCLLLLQLNSLMRTWNLCYSSGPSVVLFGLVKSCFWWPTSASWQRKTIFCAARGSG